MSAFSGLRAWWVPAIVVAVGLAGAAAGQVLFGGLVMAAGFAVALLIRAVRPAGDPAVGALHLRVRPMDLWLYSALAINVAGATLLVVRDMNVLVLGIVDALLLVWGAVLVAFEARDGGSDGATAVHPARKGTQ